MAALQIGCGAWPARRILFAACRSAAIATALQNQLEEKPGSLLRIGAYFHKIARYPTMRNPFVTSLPTGEGSYRLEIGCLESPSRGDRDEDSAMASGRTGIRWRPDDEAQP